MRITARDLHSLGVIDRIVPEPLGGAHRDPAGAIGSLKGAVLEELDGCATYAPQDLLRQRRDKFLAVG
jgi:acetyl-CoA carboxylase carboxyl transferase subunit alpha